MWNKKDKASEPKKWLIALGGFIVLFAIMTVVAVNSGEDTAQLDSAAKELAELESQASDLTDDEILAARETHVAEIEGVREQLTADLSALITSKDFDAFGETYGQEFKVVVETELTNSDYTDVKVLSQPILHVDNSYPMDIVFDNSLHMFVYYNFETDTVVPQYVNHESEAE